jgi:hypothetical protein
MKSEIHHRPHRHVILDQEALDAIPKAQKSTSVLIARQDAWWMGLPVYLNRCPFKECHDVD